MTLSLFYNTITEEVIDYNKFKRLYPNIKSWPPNPLAIAIDQILSSSNPPNIYLKTNPTLPNWERLYQDVKPGCKIWEKPILDTPTFSVTNNRWEQHYSIVPKNAGEMESLAGDVAFMLGNLRDLKLETAELEFNGLFSDGSVRARGTVSNLIEFLKSEGSHLTINWRGLKDNSNLPRWVTATVDDLQGLSVVINNFQQKAYNAENITYQTHLNTPFDYWEDVEAFFYKTYDNS